MRYKISDLNGSIETRVISKPLKKPIFRKLLTVRGTRNSYATAVSGLIEFQMGAERFTPGPN